MRRLRFSLLTIAALALGAAFFLHSGLSQPQPPQAAPVPPGPYKPVPIKLPPQLNDPSFNDFRKRLAEIAQNKDRSALAPLVAATFFWSPEDKDIADKKLPPIDNLSKALGLGGPDALGWEALALYAAESSTMPDPQRSGVVCAPVEAIFDEKTFEELVTVTQTDASDWVFPIAEGIEVRADAKKDAPVIDKLGWYLIRILPDDSPLNAVHATFWKVMTPAGKVGYVPVESVLSLVSEPLCYVKEAGGWKIAGFYGGEANQ